MAVAPRPLGRLLIVDNGTHFLTELLGALIAMEVKHELVSGERPIAVDFARSFDGAILTGGDAHIYSPEQRSSMAVEAQLTTLAQIPLLGICLGHQLIAHHHGSTIGPLASAVDAIDTIELIDHDALFEGLPRRFRARVAHDDTVSRLIPPLTSLARSSTGAFDAIRHRDLPIYGLQFHPEASGARGRQILENFAGLCSAYRPTVQTLLR